MPDPAPFPLPTPENLTFDIDAVAREMRARGQRFVTSFHTYQLPAQTEPAGPRS